MVVKISNVVQKLSFLLEILGEVDIRDQSMDGSSNQLKVGLNLVSIGLEIL